MNAVISYDDYYGKRQEGCSCGCGTIIIIGLLLYIIHLLGGF